MKRYLSNQFEFFKERKAMYAVTNNLGITGYPREFQVFSVNTGRTVKFVMDDEAAEANEFWDGEMMAYVPLEYLPNVDKVILTAE